MLHRHLATVLMLLAALLGSACGPAGTTDEPATQPPTTQAAATATGEPTATATAHPTRTLVPTSDAGTEPTPTSEPTTIATPTEATNAGLTSTPAADAEPLRVVVGTEQTLHVWDEATGTTTEVLLSEDAMAPRLSDDRTLIAFRRPVDKETQELWVLPADGGDAHHLTTIAAAETLARYPDAVDVSFSHRWVPDTHLLAYSTHPHFDALGDVPSEAVRIVDAETGESHVVLPAGEVNAVTYAPDGRQLAALTADELRLVDTRDGSVSFTLPLPLRDLRDQSVDFSPDGRQLVVFTTEGIVIVDTETHAHRSIDLTYDPIGVGHTSVTPPIDWIDDTTFRTLTVEDDTTVWQDDAAFTVWEIDVTAATKRQLNTLDGFVLSAAFSPDGRRLAFYEAEGNHRTLYLAEDGEPPRAYDDGRLPEFVGWAPDSTRFLYRFADAEELYLGDVAGEPARLDVQPVATLHDVRWVDDDRFLAIDGGAGELRLRLHTLASDSTLIATSEDESLWYDFYYGDGNVG